MFCSSPRLAVLLAISVTLAPAQDLSQFCGTTYGRARSELFLHQRNAAARASQRLGPRAASASLQTDIGDIAVMDDSGGVVARRNSFNLDRQTLSFTPSSSGYRVDLYGDTFDANASAQGTRLNLTDDDTEEISLPFPLRFYNTEYSSAFVNSNGSLTFTKGDTDTSTYYGHFVAGPPAITPLFTDLDPSRASTLGGVRVLSEPDRLTITWANIPMATSPSIQNFQLRVFPDGHLEMAFQGTSPFSAVTGITPGGFASTPLVHFSASAGTGYVQGVAEAFSSSDSIDVFYAAQRFYQTHGDAYDYLVFFNSSNIPADSGVVAYEVTARSSGQGYGDIPKEIGAEFGSKQRLQAVLNMGPLVQYPYSPYGTVTVRGTFDDSPLSLLAHEAGHLFLALVSVPDPNNPASFPMLTSDFAHWAFPFNSDASVLGGNRIEDRGPAAYQRFWTTAVTQGYSALDQYLMGLRAPEEVPSTFVVLNSGVNGNSASQVAIGMNGQRLDVSVSDIIRDFGRRTPDSTVAQHRFRFAFILIVPSGADIPQSSVDQVERYRSEFEYYFNKVSSGRGVADARLQRRVGLSLAPASGVIEGTSGLATLEIDQPAAAPLTFHVTKPNDVLLAPGEVTIPAGATRASFPIYGGRRGVEEFSAEPIDSSYETAVARVQVSRLSDLDLAVAAVDPFTVRVEDQNKLVYSGVPVGGQLSGGNGEVVIPWQEASATASIQGKTSAPHIDSVLNAASYQPRIAPETYISIFGSNLANAKLTLAGQSVTPLYSSSTQVNFLPPATISPGVSILTVETPSGIAAYRLQIEPYAPGIFPASSSVQSPGLVWIYYTGIPSASVPVRFFDNGLEIPVAGTNIFAFVRGLYGAPLSLQPGSHDISISVNGIQSNTVRIQVPAGL